MADKTALPRCQRIQREFAIIMVFQVEMAIALRHSHKRMPRHTHYCKIRYPGISGKAYESILEAMKHKIPFLPVLMVNTYPKHHPFKPVLSS